MQIFTSFVDTVFEPTCSLESGKLSSANDAFFEIRGTLAKVRFASVERANELTRRRIIPLERVDTNSNFDPKLPSFLIQPRYLTTRVANSQFRERNSVRPSNFRRKIQSSSISWNKFSIARKKFRSPFELEHADSKFPNQRVVQLLERYLGNFAKEILVRLLDVCLRVERRGNKHNNNGRQSRTMSPSIGVLIEKEYVRAEVEKHRGKSFFFRSKRGTGTLMEIPG